MKNDVDMHSPADLAAWLRKRADENRRVSELPPDEWPRSAGLLKHLAFRFDQAAQIVEQMERDMRHAPRGECICPNCGLRHGGSNVDGGF